MPAAASHRSRARKVRRVLVVGDAIVYAVDESKLAMVSPKSAMLERELRAIPNVTVCDDLVGQTNALLEPIRLFEVRALLQRHYAANRSASTGPTIALRRGGVW